MVTVEPHLSCCERLQIQTADLSWSDWDWGVLSPQGVTAQWDPWFWRRLHRQTHQVQKRVTCRKNNQSGKLGRPERTVESDAFRKVVVGGGHITSTLPSSGLKCKQHNDCITDCIKSQYNLKHYHSSLFFVVLYVNIYVRMYFNTPQMKSWPLACQVANNNNNKSWSSRRSCVNYTGAGKILSQHFDLNLKQNNWRNMDKYWLSGSSQAKYWCLTSS